MTTKDITDQLNVLANATQKHLKRTELIAGFVQSPDLQEHIQDLIRTKMHNIQAIHLLIHDFSGSSLNSPSPFLYHLWVRLGKTFAMDKDAFLLQELKTNEKLLISAFERVIYDEALPLPILQQVKQQLSQYIGDYIGLKKMEHSYV
ncbi:MAG: hypothetical protein AAF206_26435 [Bacteroidota bacterium]